MKDIFPFLILEIRPKHQQYISYFNTTTNDSITIYPHLHTLSPLSVQFHIHSLEIHSDFFFWFFIFSIFIHSFVSESMCINSEDINTVYKYVCICMCVQIYITHIQTHTHTHYCYGQSMICKCGCFQSIIVQPVFRPLVCFLTQKQYYTWWLSPPNIQPTSVCCGCFKSNRFWFQGSSRVNSEMPSTSTGKGEVWKPRWDRGMG